MKKTYKILLSILLIMLVFPFFVMLLWVFTKRWEWPYLFPQSFSIRGIKHLIDPVNQIGVTVLGSIGLSVIVTFLTLLITLPAVKALTFYPIRGKKFWQLLIWAPLIIPTTTIGMGIHKQMIRMGLANSLLGVIIVQLIPCIPYGILMLQEVYELVGEKLEVQARILGANSKQAFFHITLPLIMPGIMLASVFIFTVSFGQYFLTFLIGGGNVMTLPMLMFPYIAQGDRILASTYSFLFVFIIFVCIHLFEKVMKHYYKF